VADPGDTLSADLAATVEATRRAERELFGAMDQAARERPLREGDWTPQDHQAHLTAWKGRQAERFDAAREGREIPPTTEGEETDAINAELQALRAGWAWNDLVREADETAQRLADGIRATDAQVIRDSNRLIGGTFGNGVLHALVHFRWLAEARTGIDEARIRAFAQEAERLVRVESIPDVDRAVGLYDIACHFALNDGLDEARDLLREAFRLRPDLIEYAPTDADLTALHGELESLASA
jgi:hypothetical protein